MPATSRELRNQRRAAERKSKKLARKRQAAAPVPITPAATATPSPSATPLPGLSETRHAVRNRQNAQHSTGPRTEEGKAIASQNAMRHGLSSRRFVLLDWESSDDFAELLANLRGEHQPRTQTEALLVERMAEHFWLSQRALHLQDMCLRRDIPLCDEPKELALYLRYQTTHTRAFHKCLSDFLKLRAEQRKAEAGFVSQQHKAAAEARKQEIHSVRLGLLNIKKIEKGAKLAAACSLGPTSNVVPVEPNVQETSCFAATAAYASALMSPQAD
jgi:hypothetical protein